MPVHKVTKGLDIPIAGVPVQAISDARPVSRVGVLIRDFHYLKARVLVEPGDQVRLGQPILEDRTHPAIQFVAPASGRVEAVHRGDRRALLSVVIAVDASEAPPVQFASYSHSAASTEAGVRALLLESGLWTALRTRPFSRVPAPDARPHSLFVTATDTNPLAPDLDVVLRAHEDDLLRGLAALTLLTDGPLYLCRRPGSTIGSGAHTIPGVQVEEFTGRHPSGTVGYHIHALDPVDRNKSVWHIGAQDVARIGHLLASGRLDTSVVVALGGPMVAKPRLLRTRLGASIGDLLRDELRDVGTNGSSPDASLGATHGTPHSASHAASRVISGSVLTGDQADDDAEGFLGRFHQQVTVVAEGGARELLGWLAPGANAFSALPAFLSSVFRKRQFNLDTSLHGSRRAMVPIGVYEQVMPMDLMPTHLLRALTVGDLEWAEELGVLELDEEDLALCSFVCPGKYEHGAALRRALNALIAEQ